MALFYQFNHDSIYCLAYNKTVWNIDERVEAKKTFMGEDAYKEIKKQTDFTVRYGISAPKALPEYLNSYDYMTHYNLAYQNDGNKDDYFNQEEMNHFKSGNPYRYPSVDYYSNEFLNPFKSFFDVNGEFIGGNKIAKYYSNFGVYSTGDMFKMGDGKDARNNIYNMRINVDVQPIDLRP